MIAREGLGGPAEVEELYNVGLSTINAFGGGWARAFIPLFMTVSPPLDCIHTEVDSVDYFQPKQSKSYQK